MRGRMRDAKSYIPPFQVGQVMASNGSDLEEGAWVQSMNGWREHWRLCGQRRPALPRDGVLDGIERMPEAFIGLLRGDNMGKMLVRVGPDPR
jgi:NADPH-dependent curcumin reductase CurA